MIALDTSVAVAAFASWHEAHILAVEAIGPSPRLPAHAAIETFSVLTRLPPPHRASAKIVSEFLEGRFPEPFLTLPEAAHRQLILDATRFEMMGGSIYDALVAATALHAGAKLLSLDRRAASIYRHLGVEFELL
jgi:predicted nucleic acid-binding protein